MLYQTLKKGRKRRKSAIMGGILELLEDMERIRSFPIFVFLLI
jgi:hypothetical protein